MTAAFIHTVTVFRTDWKSACAETDKL